MRTAWSCSGYSKGKGLEAWLGFLETVGRPGGDSRVSGQREAVVRVGTQTLEGVCSELEEKGLSVLNLDMTWLHTIIFL